VLARLAFVKVFLDLLLHPDYSAPRLGHIDAGCDS
jgi:hypothetical protein